MAEIDVKRLRELARRLRDTQADCADSIEAADAIDLLLAEVEAAKRRADVSGMARRALTATDSDRVTLIAALQKALAYWMPKVFDDRSAHDAYLLVGYEGETEARCWGDEIIASTPHWTPISDGLPPEPGWYLVMLHPDNDWCLMSDAPLQVEFGAYTSKPESFTCLYDYRLDEDITAAVTHWMPMPTPPIAALAQRQGEGS
ncbi:DUF551 domain-containing protein [Burkholderia multivorans]|nr:DUF551 domain-containing protein [Burkholderia multivorans]